MAPTADHQQVDLWSNNNSIPTQHRNRTSAGKSVKLVRYSEKKSEKRIRTCVSQIPAWPKRPPRTLNPRGGGGKRNENEEKNEVKSKTAKDKESPYLLRLLFLAPVYGGAGCVAAELGMSQLGHTAAGNSVTTQQMHFASRLSGPAYWICAACGTLCSVSVWSEREKRKKER